MQPPLIPPASPRASLAPVPSPGPLRSTADVRSPTGPLISPAFQQPLHRQSIDHGTKWKNLPIHEDVAKAEVVAEEWPLGEGVDAKGGPQRERSGKQRGNDIGNEQQHDERESEQSVQSTAASAFGEGESDALTNSPPSEPIKGIVEPGNTAGIGNEFTVDHVKSEAERETEDVENSMKGPERRAETPSELQALGRIAKGPNLTSEGSSNDGIETEFREERA